MTTFLRVLGNRYRYHSVARHGAPRQTIGDIERETFAALGTAPAIPQMNPVLWLLGAAGCAGFIIVLPFIAAALASVVLL